MKTFTSTVMLIVVTAAGLQAQLPAPASVTAVETSPGVITLTWTPVPGAKSYNIMRSVWPNGFGRFSLDYKETTLVDKDVKAGVQHTYSVAGVSAAKQQGRGTRSNTLVSGGNPRAVVSAPRRAGRVTINGKIPEDVVDEFDVAEYDSLLTPRPDTISAAKCKADAERKSNERLNRLRALRDTSSEPEAEKQPKSPEQLAYNEGKCRSPLSPGYPVGWTAVAHKSDLTHDEQVRLWREINIVALAYKHLLQRDPTAEEIRRDVTVLSRGKHWKVYWRELAQSDERDKRFGYWAPAPMPSRDVAKQVFGTKLLPRPEICFGALGPACGGTLPLAHLEPRWFGHFRLPDGTEMAYVSIGGAVGSILHDNACLADYNGLNCSGLGAGDLWKDTGWPAALEWNKASWNVLNGRTWRDVWGPYPASKYEQSLFFDDLRAVAARPSKMAVFVSLLTVPLATEPYRGGETKRSHALYAPKGTWLDQPDAAFCASGAFSQQELPPLSSVMGKCK